VAGDPVAGFLVAVAACAATFALRVALVPVLGDLSPYLLFTLPVVVAAWYGGLAPGLVAVALGGAGGHYFSVLHRGPHPGQLLQLAVFVLTGAAITSIAGALRGARRRAHERAEALARIFDTASEGVCTVDRTGTIVFANPRFAQMVGARVEQIVGKPLARFLDVVPAAHLPDTPEAQAARDFDSSLRRSDGSALAVRVSEGALVGPGGEPLSALWMLTDVSELRAAQASLARALEAERSAREAAQKANRAKDEFLAMLSHDLRTPLNAMLGWVQILKRGPQRPGQLERALDVIERNAQRQAQLVEDLLDVSRIAAGKMKIERRPVALAPIVRAAVDSIAQQARARSIEIETEIEEATVLADPKRLEQVVWNLLTNAVKFSPEGGTVLVRSRVDASATIEVIDRGRGIASEFLAHVFERFSQEERGEKLGLGLGLAISRQIVEAHGGRIDVHSDGVGCGATFRVTLPLATSPASDPALPAPTATSALAGRAILVVDDDRDGREIIAEMLARAGARVTTASSATDAIRLLGSEPFDLLVCDLAMPDKGGLELVRELRRSSGPNAGVRALALSAHARAEDGQRAIDAGFQRFAAKPIDADDLVRCACAVMDLGDC
jgi:PAS domain S-box-containing protein